MAFHHRRPGPPLDASVESVWVCRRESRPTAFERILPSPGPQLIVNLGQDQTRLYVESPRGLVCRSQPGCILTGVTTRFQIIDTDEQEQVAGVAFRPGGTRAFVALPSDELRDTDVPLEALWGAARVRALRERLLHAATPASALDVLEEALLASWRDVGAHRAVTAALAAFQARPSVVRIQDVADAVGLSPKRFIERFKTDVGVTPKRYCRLLRFQRAVAGAHQGRPIDWCDLALACGYVDQAHMIHEFREFSGLTPAGYEASRTAFQNHVTFLQSAGA